MRGGLFHLIKEYDFHWMMLMSSKVVSRASGSSDVISSYLRPQAIHLAGLLGESRYGVITHKSFGILFLFFSSPDLFSSFFLAMKSGHWHLEEF